MPISINDFEKHKNFFLEYAQDFLHEHQDPCLVLKKQHTLRVVENTQKILAVLDLSEEDVYCAQLVALYHDIGRFMQYEKYRTFLDKKSENHAHISVRILKKQTIFLSEPQIIRQKVLAAIILHNTLELPKKLAKQFLSLCQIIRDADKLDIISVMVQNFNESLPEKDSVLLHVKDEPSCYTKTILEQAMKKDLIRYTDLRYVNDFKILLCNWIFSLYFSVSKKILLEKGDIQKILYSLPKNEAIKNYQSMFEKELENYNSLFL